MSALGAIGLLLVVAAVIVEVGRAVASVRRARRLNQGMHELRRPLQTLGLIIERGGSDSEAGMACMAQARAAMNELEAIVNRVPPPLQRRSGDLAEVIRSLRARWRAAGVAVSAAGLDGEVRDPTRLAAAIDNLVANAIEHGSRPVSVRAGGDPESVWFEVRDAGAVGPRPPRRRNRRRGHGLEVVREFAEVSGGSADLNAGLNGAGTTATIKIPVERTPMGGRREPERSDGAA